MQQASVALGVYVDRGRQALLAYHEGKVDRFIRLLRKRSAAFHNFRAADAILMKDGIDISQEEAFREIWESSKVVDSEVAVALNAATGEVKSDLIQQSRVRATIGKYRSSALARSVFFQTV